MKKQIQHIGITMLTLLVLACSKDEVVDIDYSIPENLVGTTWEAPSFPGTSVEYALLDFLSETRVQALTKRAEQEIQVDWTGVFEIVSDSIFITYEIEGLRGLISQTDIIFENDNGEEIRFSLQ
nr:hypothetical protein [uncultured Allomuricauda sp.]